MFENVSALVSNKFIRLFNDWKLTLERLGYTNFTQVLNAKDYGVPQNRERIFMVSVLDETARYEFPDPMPLTIRLKDVLEKEVDERYYLSQQVIDSFESHKERNAANGNGFGWNPTDGDVIANAILTGSLRHTDNFIAEPKCQVVGTMPYKSGYENTARVYAADGLAPSIQSMDGGNTQPKVVEPQVLGWVRYEKGNVVKRPVVEVANCVTSGKRDNTQNYVVETSYRIRKLTERECFRLMDMPDEYIDRIQAAGISRSQQYKMAGNSIVVACMYHILRKLFIDTEIKTLTLF